MNKEEIKKQFLKNTKFIIDGMLSNNYDLEEKVQQLQSYKQKEDKLREYVNTIDNWNYKKLEGRTNQINRDELLQILNEGDK